MSCAGATGRQIDDHIDLLRYPLRYPHARLRWTGHVHRRVGGVKGVRLSESCRRHRQPFQRHDSGVSNVARPAPRETAGASGQCSTSAHRSRFSHAALARSSFSSLHFALCLSGPLQSSYSSKYPGQYAVAVKYMMTYMYRTKGSASPDQLHGSACSLCILLQECILSNYISPHATRETVSPTPRATAMTSTCRVPL